MDSIFIEQRKWSSRDVAQLLTSRTALTELSIDDALKIVKIMESRRVKAGTVLMQEGVATTSYMMLVLRGEASVVQESVRKSDSLVLNVLGAGQIIGEMGFLDGEPRSATCTAFSDMDVAVLNRDAFATLLVTEPTTACHLMGCILQRVSARLRANNRKMRALDQLCRNLELEVEVMRSMGVVADLETNAVNSGLMGLTA